jgi:uncharacterized protein (DUF885 family)
VRCGVLLTGLILLVTMAGGTEPAQSTNEKAPSGNNATKRLREFLAADWKYWIAEYPENATLFGYPGENDRWTDYSPQAIARRDRHLRESLAELEAIPRNELPAGEQLNYDLYREQLQTTIAGAAFHDDAFPVMTVSPTNLYMPINQVSGMQQYVPATIAQMSMEGESDYRDLIARLNGIPAVVDQTIDLMKEGTAHGWTPPRITMRDVAKQAGAQVVSDPMTSPMLAAFKKFPEAVPAAEREELKREAVAAYTGKAAPAFAKLRDFLAQTYVPACRDTISVTGLPGGADYYKYLVRWQTTTGMSAQEIHQVGLDQVKEIRAEIDEAITQAGFAGRFAGFVKFVNSDSRFRYQSADDMLLHYRAIAKEVDPELAGLFGLLPRLPYGVTAVPDAIAPSQFEAYYQPGSPIAGRAGYLFVNTYDLPSRRSWDAEDLVLHEGVPGHHLQISLAQEMKDVPEFRKQLGYTAYVEGWALYSESLGPDVGLYTDPYSKFGYLSAQMWRAVRLVVDTGIHSMGWSRDQAIEYFIENTGQPEQNAIVEIDRYIVWPGQALGYKIGQLKIQKLRKMAERELGARFDVRRFHDAVLDQGALPLDILEARIKQWTAEQKTKIAAN